MKWPDLKSNYNPIPVLGNQLHKELGVGPILKILRKENKKTSRATDNIKKTGSWPDRESICLGLQLGFNQVITYKLIHIRKIWKKLRRLRRLIS